MKRIALALATVVALTGAVNAFDISAEGLRALEAAMRGSSTGTPKGQALAGKFLYYRLTCPNMTEAQKAATFRFQGKNGGAAAALDNMDPAEAEANELGVDEWCEGVSTGINAALKRLKRGR